MARPLVFVHLPKTAGSTISAIVRARYPGYVRGTQPEWDEWITGRVALPPAPAYLGHMPYGIHLMLGRPVDYVTMVRHPVARAVSHYHYLRQHPDHGAHREALVPLEDWAATTEMNLVTLRLAGGTPEDRILARRQNGKLLHVAIDHAEEFLAIGMQERFEESLALLSRRLGWGVPHYRSRKVSHPYPAPSARAVQILVERNQLDVALFDYLRQRLDHDLKATRLRVVALRARNPRTVQRVEAEARRWSGLPARLE